MNVSELKGSALDWAVSQAMGVEYRYIKSTGGDYNGNWWYETRRYSTDWAQGGPVIESEGIGYYKANGSKWWAHPYGGEYNAEGPTPLIAAMRCYVASKLGNEIDIPKELLK